MAAAAEWKFVSSQDDKRRHGIQTFVNHIYKHLFWYLKEHWYGISRKEYVTLLVCSFLKKPKNKNRIKKGDYKDNYKDIFEFLSKISAQKGNIFEEEDVHRHRDFSEWKKF